MLRIFFPPYSLQRRYQSVTILNLTKLVFGKSLEERLLHTSVPPKENQNCLKTIYFFFLFQLHHIALKTFQDQMASLFFQLLINVLINLKL